MVNEVREHTLTKTLFTLEINNYSLQNSEDIMNEGMKLHRITCHISFVTINHILAILRMRAFFIT